MSGGYGAVESSVSASACQGQTMAGVSVPPVQSVTVCREAGYARLPTGRRCPASRPDRLTWKVRIWLLLIAASLVSVFGIAAWLQPYNPDGTPRRMATHRQLGLPPCNFAVLTGKPCPSCGMTTSFALLVHGDVRASLQANWVGTCLACVAAVALPWSVLSAWRGRLLLVPPGKGELFLTIGLTLLLILMLGRWIGVLLLSNNVPG
ncbi:MAG: DUF2752 domain-containing protein [Thermogemmata sp.]|nr:DUF2752 domain-containing protein [Thermogemmata sp.]